ncbi:hypothetical protein ACLOJK_040229 [Asimina triloba]
MVVTVERGTSSSIYLYDSAYRSCIALHSPTRQKSLPLLQLPTLSLLCSSSSRNELFGGLRCIDTGKKDGHEVCEAALTKSVIKMLNKVNENGPYVGLVAPSSSELHKLIGSSSFYPGGSFKYIDYAGRRFHIGSIEGKRVIAAMSGKGMRAMQTRTSIQETSQFPNPGLTQAYGTGKYGDGPDDELSLETDGPFTRDIGSLNFADYDNKTDEAETSDNFLNSVWFQPEDIFPVDGTPESSEQVFWVPVDSAFYDLSKKLEANGIHVVGSMMLILKMRMIIIIYTVANLQDMQLEGCIHADTCLPNTPKVVTVKRGSSSNIYLDNAAYRTFLNTEFQVSPADMESAAVALISHQKKVPFIAFRALSDLAGERPTETNGGDDSFTSLAVSNCVNVVLQFIKTMDRPMYTNGKFFVCKTSFLTNSTTAAAEFRAAREMNVPASFECADPPPAKSESAKRDPLLQTYKSHRRNLHVYRAYFKLAIYEVSTSSIVKKSVCACSSMNADNSGSL